MVKYVPPSDVPSSPGVFPNKKGSVLKVSYAVVRVQKMRASGVKGIEIHDRRVKGGVSHSNPDIDWTRSKDNYDIHHAQNKNFYRAVKNRINSLNLPKAVRKDAVVMAQVIVTSDTAFFDQLRDRGGDDAVRQFFQSSYDFLENRYGKENIISSTVHLDERTPHMHFNFVPVTADNRLCAKEVTARATIFSLHDAFRDNVGQHYGLLRGDPKESGKRQTHLETAEYKAVMKEVEQEQARSAGLKEKNDALDAAIEKKRREYKQLFSGADKELQETIKTAERVRADAEADAAKIRADAINERNRAVQEREKLAGEIDSLTEKKEGLLLEANRATQERDRLAGVVESLTEEETALRGKLEWLTVGYNDCVNDCNTLKKNYIDLANRYNSQKSELAGLEKSLMGVKDFISGLLGSKTLTELKSSGRVETKKFHLDFGGMICRKLDAAGIDHAIALGQDEGGRLLAQVSVRSCDGYKLDTTIERTKPELAQRRAQQSQIPPPHTEQNRGNVR